MSKPLLADVIVSAGREVATTLPTLEAVLQRSGDALRSLIVIEDDLTGNDLDAALSRLADRDARVRLVRDVGKLGFAESSNRGLALRAGDAVLLAAGTRVAHGWLRELAEVASLDERTACVLPSLGVDAVANDGTTLRAACAGLPRWTDVPAGVGPCLYLRGALLDLLGGLDPSFPLGRDAAEDWVMRAQAMGFVARRANHAHVIDRAGAEPPWVQDHQSGRVGQDLRFRHPHYLAQLGRFDGTLDRHLVTHAIRVESSGRLRVALDFRHVPAQYMGTSAYAVNLAHELSRRAEIELSLVVRDPAQSHGVAARVVHEGEPLTDVEVVHRPAQVLDPGDLNLLFGSTAHVVITCQDLISHRAQGIFPRQAAADRYRTTNYLAVQAAQATIAISASTRREIALEYGIPEEEIAITLEGVHPEMFQVVPAQGVGLRGRLGVAGRYFLSVAADFPHKNVHNLLDAYDQFRRAWHGDGEAPALVLVGHKVASRLGAYERLDDDPPRGVVFRGGVAQDELAALYQGAEALVFPSVYEGFGLPPLEAMAAGTPVIGLPIASIPEVCADAILYPAGMSSRDLAESMRVICVDRGLREDLIARGRARIERFRWERTAQATSEVYRSVVSRPSERSLRARRLLLEVFPGWANHVHERPIGIRNACQDLHLAVKARARRELGRFGLLEKS